MRSISIDWVIVLAGAVGVIGILEWTKGWFTTPRPWLFRILVPILCFVIALLPDGGWGQIGINAILMWAICQIGYETVISSVRKLIEKKVG